MPPDSSCGYSSSRWSGFEMPTRSIRSRAALRAASPRNPRCKRRASPICVPMRCTGLSALAGSWKISATRPPRMRHRSRGAIPISSCPSNRTEPETIAPPSNSAKAASQVIDLPQPLSPTTPSVSPRRTVRSTPCSARTYRFPISKSTVSPSKCIRGGIEVVWIGVMSGSGYRSGNEDGAE